MKTQLTFNFDDEDNEDKLKRIINTDSAYMSLWDMSQWLREHYKYHEEHSEEVLDFIDKAREEFYNIMERNDIDLDRDWS